MSKRTFRSRDDGKLRYFTLACRATNILKLQPVKREGSKAKIYLNVTICPNGIYRLSYVVLDHIYTLSWEKQDILDAIYKKYVKKET